MKALKIIILILVIITVIGELLSTFGEVGVEILSILLPLALVVFILTRLSRRKKKDQDKT
jgi:hypothetical protein